jgi:hypothetical protein
MTGTSSSFDPHMRFHHVGQSSVNSNFLPPSPPLPNPLGHQQQQQQDQEGHSSYSSSYSNPNPAIGHLVEQQPPKGTFIFI